MAFAQKHPRPVVIGEFGLTQEGRPGQRADWLREVGPYLKKHPQIKAALYFAAEQTSGPLLYDSTFNKDPGSAAVFREMATDPYFTQPPPDLTASSGPPSTPTR